MRQEQIAEQRLVVARLLQLQHARSIEPLDFQIERLVNRLRAEASIRPAEHAHAAGQKVAQLHEANRHHAVEPGIRRALLQAGVAMGRIALAQLGLQLQQFGALFALDGRKRQRAHSIGGSIRHALGGDAVFLHAQFDALLELFTSLYAKCFDGRIVHSAPV